MKINIEVEISDDKKYCYNDDMECNYFEARDRTPLNDYSICHLFNINNLKVKNNSVLRCEECLKYKGIK
jgi:hypothetical protein